MTRHEGRSSDRAIELGSRSRQRPEKPLVAKSDQSQSVASGIFALVGFVAEMLKERQAVAQLLTGTAPPQAGVAR